MGPLSRPFPLCRHASKSRPSFSAPPLCVPPTTRKRIFPSVVCLDAPAPLTTWGDPRLTTDRWMQEKAWGRSGASASALKRLIWPSGDWNLLRPPALCDIEQLGKKQGAAGVGRAGNGGNRVSPSESVRIAPRIPRQSLWVQPEESNSKVSKTQWAEHQRFRLHVRRSRTTSRHTSSLVILGRKSDPAESRAPSEKVWEVRGWTHALRSFPPLSVGPGAHFGVGDQACGSPYAPGVGWGPCVPAPGPLQEAPSTEAGLSLRKHRVKVGGKTFRAPAVVSSHAQET